MLVLGGFNHFTEEGSRCSRIATRVSNTSEPRLLFFRLSLRPTVFPSQCSRKNSNKPLKSIKPPRLVDEGSQASPSTLQYPGLSHQCNKVFLAGGLILRSDPTPQGSELPPSTESILSKGQLTITSSPGMRSRLLIEVICHHLDMRSRLLLEVCACLSISLRYATSSIYVVSPAP